MYHYTYLITNIQNNKKYIGVRSCDSAPYEDIGIKYFSSSSDKTFREDQVSNPGNYQYKVLAVFETRELAQLHEIELHHKHDIAINELFYNKSKATSTGFSTAGVKFKRQNTENYFGPKSKEHCKNLRKACKGIRKTEEHKRKISETHADMSGENNPMYGREGEDSGFGGKNHSDEHKKYMSNLVRNKPRIKCPHCDVVGAVSQMKRWHFDNCKEKRMKNKEIERKFLVSVEFRDKIKDIEDIFRIKQGYMFDGENGVARVRQRDSQYFVTFKSPVEGITCDEIEFPVSEEHGSALFNKFTTKTLSKLRYVVNHKGHTWEIDYFLGKLKGLVVAEIELKSEDEKFELPEWVLEEVTGNKEYYNSNLVNI